MLCRNLFSYLVLVTLLLSCGSLPKLDDKDILKYSNAVVDFSVFSSLLFSNILFVVYNTVFERWDCIKKNGNIADIDCRFADSWSYQGRITFYEQNKMFMETKIIGSNNELRVHILELEGEFDFSFTKIKLKIDNAKMFIPDDKIALIENIVSYFPSEMGNTSVGHLLEKSVFYQGGEKISFRDTKIILNFRDFSLGITGYISYEGCTSLDSFVESKIVFDPNNVYPIVCPQGNMKLTGNRGNYQINFSPEKYSISSSDYTCDFVSEISCDLGW